MDGAGGGGGQRVFLLYFACCPSCTFFYQHHSISDLCVSCGRQINERFSCRHLLSPFASIGWCLRCHQSLWLVDPSRRSTKGKNNWMLHARIRVFLFYDYSWPICGRSLTMVRDFWAHHYNLWVASSFKLIRVWREEIGLLALFTHSLGLSSPLNGA